MSVSMPKIMRIYGKFLLEVLNDKDNGEKLIERSRNQMSMKNNKKSINFGSGDQNDSTPTIILTTD